MFHSIYKESQKMAIWNIRHKGLRLLSEKDKQQGVPHEHVGKLKRVLTVLDNIKALDDLDGIPGLKCHPLKGNKKGFHSIFISRNRRVTFRIHKENVYDVNFEDYH